jgi:nucleoid-associated protein YgaU
MYKSIRFGLLPIALALAGPLMADDATPAPAANDQAAAVANNKQLSDELASSWKENEHLKADLAAAQASTEKSDATAADLRKQLDAARAQPAAPAPGDADVARQLADVQDKLATSLRSYSVVQDENTDLKASVEKLTSDNASLSQQLEAAKASIASLQVQAAATAQIEPLRTQLRQAQDEASHLAAENEQLRTRAALLAPGPGASKPTPTRPGQAALAPAAPAEAAAPPPPAPKTYVVAEGDTLTRIARKFYGSPARWQDILNANHDVLKDEKSLVVGSTLKIP